MAWRSVDMVSPNRTQYPPMVRQSSLYNLAFDEVQSQLGNAATTKMSFNVSLSTPEKNAISEAHRESSGQVLVQQDPSSHHSLFLGSLNGSTILSNKTNNSISEAWRGIVHQEHVNRSTLETPFCGNLENFILARAGVINLGGDHHHHPQDHNVDVIGGDDTTPHHTLMGMDPMVVMPSNQEHWLQMQIPGMSLHQHHQQHEDHEQINIGGCQEFNVPKSFYETSQQVMEIGYSENSTGISMLSPSPAYSDSKCAVFGKNKYSDEVLEKTIERRQKRMAKNRESAARSRAKKQEHINKLEKEKCRLQKMNSHLKKLKELDSELFSATTTPTPRYQLRRSNSTTTF